MVEACEPARSGLLQDRPRLRALPEIDCEIEAIGREPLSERL